jgi:hypothetical protein
LRDGVSFHWRLPEGEFPRDRRDLGIGEEPLVILNLPVEEHPHPVGVIGIPEHLGALAPVLLSLLDALGLEGLQELIEVGDLGDGDDHVFSLE